MNDRLANELLTIYPSHPILDFLTLREIFQLTPISKAVMAATAYRRLSLIHHRLSRLALQLGVNNAISPDEAKKENQPPARPNRLSLDDSVRRLIQQLEQPWINHIKPYNRFKQDAIPAGSHLLLKPAYLTNLLPPAMRNETHRLSQLLGKRLLLALGSEEKQESKAQTYIAAGANLNFGHNPAVTIALSNYRFRALENILADPDVNSTRFKPGATEAAGFIAATAKALEELIDLTDSDIAAAIQFSDSLVITLTALWQRGLPKDTLYQLLALHHNKTGLLHWLAKYNKTALATFLNLLSELLVDESDALHMTRLFSLQDASLWTIGHLIAYYQNSAHNQQYLSLLYKMIEIKLSPEKLLELLKMKNDDDTTLGHLIARHRNPETNKLFLRLLITLLDRPDSKQESKYEDDVGPIIATQISQLLSIQNQNNDAIGHLLADGDMETFLLFLALIKKICLINLKLAIAILKVVDRDSAILGHKLANCHPAHVLQSYLEIMDSLLLDKSNTEAVYDIVSQQADDKWNLGHTITSHSTQENRLAFLKILIKLYQNGISVADIFYLLESQSDDLRTFGHYIAINHDNAAAVLFLTLLETLSNNDTTFPTIFSLFSMRDKNHKTCLHYFFEHLSTDTCIQLLQFLDDMRKKDPADEAEKQLLQLLTLVAKNEEKNVGTIITIWNPLVLPGYLMLLTALASNPDNTEKIYALLIHANVYGMTFGHYLSRHHDVKLIRQYLSLVNILKKCGLSSQHVIELAKQVATHWNLLPNVLSAAECLSDDELIQALSPKHFYTAQDVAIAIEEIFLKFNIHSEDTRLITKALLHILGIPSLSAQADLDYDNQSPFGYPYVIRLKLKNPHLPHHLRAPSMAKMHYQNGESKSLYIDIEYLISIILAKNGPLAQYLTELAATDPQQLYIYQIQSSHEVIPAWQDIRKNLYRIFGEYGSTLLNNTNLFYYVLLRAFQVEEALRQGYMYVTHNASFFTDPTVTFRLGISSKAAIKLTKSINERFGTIAARLRHSEGIVWQGLLMFDITLSKKLLYSPQFIHLMKSTYEGLLASPDPAIQDYIDHQFIAAELLPKSFRELALQLVEFDARHAPKSMQAGAMRVLIHLITELSEALTQHTRDNNKLRTLAATIHHEIQASKLITKFGLINEARKQFTPVEEVTTALRKRFGVTH